MVKPIVMKEPIIISMEGSLQIEYDYAKYKWEFLRRNKEYCSDWKKLMAEEKWIKERDLKGKELMIASTENDWFLKKWNLKSAINPSYGFDELVRGENKGKKKDTVTLDGVYESEDVKSRFVRDLMFIDYVQQPLIVEKDGHYETREDGAHMWKPFGNDFYNSGIFNIKININYPKNRLLDYFSDVIDEMKKVYEHEKLMTIFKEFKKEIGLNGYIITKKQESDLLKRYRTNKKDREKKYSTKKYHFENYPIYLRAYDLKNSGMSWSKIVEKLNLNSIQTARNHYNAACRLIKEGIQL